MSPGGLMRRSSENSSSVLHPAHLEGLSNPAFCTRDTGTRAISRVPPVAGGLSEFVQRAGPLAAIGRLLTA